MTSLFNSRVLRYKNELKSWVVVYLYDCTIVMALKTLWFWKYHEGIRHLFGLCTDWLTADSLIVNTSPPDTTYMHQSTGSALVSGNGVSPVWRQAITWTNAALLSIEPLGTNFSEIQIEIKKISLIKMCFKVLSVKWWPFSRGGDEIRKSSLKQQCFNLAPYPL